MKRLTERTEIATAVNFHKYPVIRIDLADRDEYGIKGAKVNIDFGGDYFIHATLRTYSDEKKLTTNQYGTMISASVSYYDYEKMLEYANAPIIKANQEILIFMVDSSKKEAYAPVLLKTGERVSKFCSTPLTIEEFFIG